MKRNFDKLEIGKHYASAAEQSSPVRIWGRSRDGFYLGSWGSVFTEDGTSRAGSAFDLVAEVSVTITPVEPPKPREPRELWVVEADGDRVGTYHEVDLAKQSADRMTEFRVGRVSVIHMREVMDGEE